jgi:hypothetical protein
MSAVIPFPTSRSPQLREAGDTGPAKIIIFPGVRIERTGFDLADRLPSGRKSSSAQSRALDYDAY